LSVIPEMVLSSGRSRVWIPADDSGSREGAIAFQIEARAAIPIKIPPLGSLAAKVLNLLLKPPH
jgi:hypothetical protein